MHRTLSVVFFFILIAGVLLSGCTFPEIQAESPKNSDPEEEPEIPASGYDWRDAVIYYVLVDRFQDGDMSNNSSAAAEIPVSLRFAGGDWVGITDFIRSSYFNNLGITALCLSMPARNTAGSYLRSDGRTSSAYHGRWPEDLTMLDSRLGSESDFNTLLAEAHGKGLKVLIEYKAREVSVSSPVYIQHADWFWPKKILGSDIQYDSPDASQAWTSDYLAAFNLTTQASRSYTISTATDWLDNYGLDGLLIDETRYMYPDWFSFLRLSVKGSSVAGAPERLLLGDTAGGSTADIAGLVDSGSKLDGQLDYPLRHALVRYLLMREDSLVNLDTFLQTNQTAYNGVMGLFLNRRGFPRAIHFAEDLPLWNSALNSGTDRAWDNQPSLPAGTSAFERLANSYTLLFSLPGVPVLYYGDEIAMPGAGDPDNQRMMIFTNYADGQTLVKNRITKLSEVRAAHPALRKGEYTSVSSGTDLLAFRMEYASDTVYVLVNRGDSAAQIGGLNAIAYTDLLTDAAVTGPTIEMPARSSRILVVQ